MTAGSNADGKWSEKAEGEDCSRTVECLRGRLLAERMASKNAKEEAQQIENKLIDLEARLKEETKSKNRAEKKLKFLMKKLESLNITWVSDESEESSFLEKSEISSISSVASSSTKEAEDKGFSARFTNSSICEIQGSVENSESLVVQKNLQQNVSQKYICTQTRDSPAAEETCGSGSNANHPELEVQKKEMMEEFMEKSTQFPKISEKSEQNAILNNTIIQCNYGPATEETSSSSVEADSSKCNELESSQKDDQSSKSSIEEEIWNEDGEEEQDDHVDNSLALVPVDLPKIEETIDPAILDATVKDVLDALRRAKEKLLTSMERRRTIKVG